MMPSKQVNPVYQGYSQPRPSTINPYPQMGYQQPNPVIINQQPQNRQQNNKATFEDYSNTYTSQRKSRGFFTGFNGCC